VPHARRKPGRSRRAAPIALAKPHPQSFSPCSSPAMEFPLKLRFKLFSFAPQIFVSDAAGASQFYIRQKLFKWRETINVFTDEKQAQQVATIQADRVVTWSARFNFTNPQGQSLGAVGRQGMRSLWRARYDLFSAANEPAGTIREENPMAKIIDGLLESIPFVGAFAGYLFQPRYLLSGPDGNPVMRLHKRPSFFMRRFEIERLSETNPEVTQRDVLALIMLVLLERRRQ
jgi:uncharacterized protein YxjI